MLSDNAQMPSDRETPLVEVFYNGNQGEQFICGFHGNVCGGVFEYVKKEFKEDPEFWDSEFKQGPGSYLFEAVFIPEQSDEGNGRIELPSYWMLNLIAFRPYEEGGD